MSLVSFGSQASRPGRAIAIPVMLVGIGFAAILTAALAQRFLTSNIHDVTDELREVDAIEADVLNELREVRARLYRLEARLTRGSA